MTHHAADCLLTVGRPLRVTCVVNQPVDHRADMPAQSHHEPTARQFSVVHVNRATLPDGHRRHPPEAVPGHVVPEPLAADADPFASRSLAAVPTSPLRLPLPLIAQGEQVVDLHVRRLGRDGHRAGHAIAGGPLVTRRRPTSIALDELSCAPKTGRGGESELG